MRRSQMISKINSILKKYKISKAYFFGSFARKEKKYNDIDIAIESPKGNFSLFDLIGLEQEITDEVGKKTDISIIGSIKPRIKKYIAKDLVEII